MSVCQLGKLISPRGPFWCQYNAIHRTYCNAVELHKSPCGFDCLTLTEAQRSGPPLKSQNMYHQRSFLDNDSLARLQERKLRLLCVPSLTPSIVPLLDSYSCSASDLSPAKLTCPGSLTRRQVALEWSMPHAARSHGFELLQWLLWRGKSCVTKVRSTPFRIFIKHLVQ